MRAALTRCMQADEGWMLDDCEQLSSAAQSEGGELSSKSMLLHMAMRMACRAECQCHSQTMPPG